MSAGLFGDRVVVSSSGELRELLSGHYSRRRTLRPGCRFGGVGDPLYLRSFHGSAFVAIWQTANGWDVGWREFPSWWVGAFRRAEGDPVKASHFLRDAWRAMQLRHPGPAYTTVNIRRVADAIDPGRVFMFAGYRYHCSTRPFERHRSLLVMRRTPSLNL